MIYQNTEKIDADAQKYSCLFNVIARAREVLCGRPWEIDEYNEYWRGAKAAGIISGDLNMDGDFDDRGEDEILDYQRIFDFLEVPLLSVSPKKTGLATMTDRNGVVRVAPQKHPLDIKKFWVAEHWVWMQGHFVQGRGTGKEPAIWDPIAGGSNTRRRGYLESLRVFPIKEA
jgi:hypothetical protein